MLSLRMSKIFDGDASLGLFPTFAPLQITNTVYERRVFLKNQSGNPINNNNDNLYTILQNVLIV